MGRGGDGQRRRRGDGKLERVGDALLIAAAARGDGASFEELVRRHGAMVYRVAFRMLGNADDAADCAQDAWMQAWRHRMDFRGTSAFTTWLYRVTTNQALMTLRRRKPTSSLDTLDEAPPPDEAAFGDERILVRSEVRRALAQLSVEHRTVLVLYEFEGLPMSQVADVLDLGLPAAKQRLRRARIALARRLDGWHEPEGGRVSDE